jgi:CheY-like chemotaxis protein
MSEKESRRPPSGTRTRLGKVLIVDDERLVARALQLALSSEFDVDITTSAQEALSWLTAGQAYETILCDVMMPGMTGVELRDRIASFSPEQAARIVFITGGLLLPHVQQWLDHVPNTCLEKPLDLDGLRELIRRRVSAAWRTAEGAI